MAFTRKMLKAMGIDDEKIEQIMDAHVEVTEALKADRDRYKADAEKLPNVQKELDDLKADGGDWKSKYETERKAFADFKSEQTAKETKTAKEKAVRAYYESKGIKGKSLDIAMRGSAAEVDAIELDGDKIKDTAAIDALIAGTYSDLVATVEQRGFNTATPPANGGTATKTKEQILAIKDGSERRKAMAENPEMFGIK